MTVHSYCVKSFESLFCNVGEGGVAVNCEKKNPEHPVPEVEDEAPPRHHSLGLNKYL